MYIGVVLRGGCERALCGMGVGWGWVGRYDAMPAEYVTLVVTEIGMVSIWYDAYLGKYGCMYR